MDTIASGVLQYEEWNRPKAVDRRPKNAALARGQTMQIPLHIDFQNMDRSEFVEKRITERVAKLEHHAEHITSCHVTVEAPHHHHHKGNEYRVRIVLHVPGQELVVSREPGTAGAHTDVYVAIRDAFDAAERQLKDRSARVRGDVKTHEPPLQGTVSRMFADKGYGFITTTDGREIYFHKNSVVETAFDDLSVGQPVRLAVAENESSEGPQATTVRPIRPLQMVPEGR